MEMTNSNETLRSVQTILKFTFGLVPIVAGAGILVLIKPAIGAYVVMAWLICIALTLIASGKYLDVAVRDLVMSIGAMSLARLSKVVK
jgi:hypothetical protein